MMYHTFDTLDVAKSFIASGMKTETAEAIAKAIAISRDTDLSHLATKADLMEIEGRSDTKINSLESKLEKQIAAVDSRLSIEIEKSKNEILRWVIGMNIATISILMAFFKLFV